MRDLPWKNNSRPLMLAPMQGLTNEALRACYLEHYRPDIVFTEFVRVQSRSRKRVMRADLAEVRAHCADIPLIVQLIGHDADALADAALEVQVAGCSHVNLNLGCPYGRMTTGATGGELLNQPERLPLLLERLRKVIRGSFSVKCRAGYSDPRQIFDLLPMFSRAGVDFLILHPRTVEQRYTGRADHALTREVIDRTDLPVVANGDINTPQVGNELLAQTAAAGLMLGRGALADPGLFERIRRNSPAPEAESQRRAELGLFITRLLPGYMEKFCGERQALMKLKDVLNFIPDDCLQRDLGRLKRATSMQRFQDLLLRSFPC